MRGCRRWFLQSAQPRSTVQSLGFWPVVVLVALAEFPASWFPLGSGRLEPHLVVFAAFFHAMGPEEELAIRQAVQEASGFWASQLQEVLKQATRRHSRKFIFCRLIGLL